jgi:hypothetical protein
VRSLKKKEGGKERRPAAKLPPVNCAQGGAAAVQTGCAPPDALPANSQIIAMAIMYFFKADGTTLPVKRFRRCHHMYTG